MQAHPERSVIKTTPAKRYALGLILATLGTACINGNNAPTYKGPASDATRTSGSSATTPGATDGAGNGGRSGSPLQASAGAGGEAGAPASCAFWPEATGRQEVAATVFVSDTYDGKLQRFVGTGRLGTSSQDEDQGALFELHEGATLKNVVIGSPAADGVHCLGSCTLENVWWEDVGEDAATFRGTSSSARSRVHCGGARNAADKIFQHNGAGTLIIESFDAENFGKLYRSCGNCMVQRQRHVVFNGITAYAGGTLAGINANYGDTARFLNVAVYGNPTICQLYTGNDTGAEPSKTGSGADGEHCFYSEADIEER